MSADLFVGLVTHPRSRFTDAATQDGLLAQTARGARSRGLTVMSAVRDEDAFGPNDLPIDRATVRSSIRAELDTERRWREHVAASPGPWWLGPFFAARRVLRTLRLAPPWGLAATDDAGSRMVRRLANIEQAHVLLISEAVASGAGWVLILEDDAYAPGGDQFGVDLAAFLEQTEGASQPQMVSLSDSFSVQDLGVEHRVHPVANPGPWHALAADCGITNTVCATLYRRDFLMRLHMTLCDIPLQPVVPIDFKINEALMRMSGEYRPGDAWLLSPAPLKQRSGVPSVLV